MPNGTRLGAALLLAGAAVLVLSPSAASRAQTPAEAGPNRGSNTRHVLFIGNSFTFFNDLPEVVAAIAASFPQGPQIEPTMFASGGMTLQWHWAAGRAQQQIDSRAWDDVILQEQSALGAGTEVGDGRLSPPGIFHESVRKFVPYVRAAGATPILLMTWARRTHPEDQALLTDAYDTIGRELHVTVSPAGVAWQATRTRWPDLDLHVADGSHPNPAGTYLTACVLYATLTGRDPRGATPHISGHPYSRAIQGIDTTQTVTLVDLAPPLARRLQEVAWSVVVQRRAKS
jgi:hypothetical protein